ncbi:hypothetical protein I5M27_11430 [Adhaeribacter sp. BT258]|uniref:Uncharacterized protein n=1 Tax=Adhaeribacter terrigena TaxID=2793070 RepID=A0ABS1C2G8_9BACT|nr:hypothetical protein [Adhaeribacter terrigena]MBK0403601.1 hypothetical protein [Adhaeribacter terrigena]
MRKICLLFICFGWLSACTTDQSETSGTESNGSQNAILKGTGNSATETDSDETNREPVGQNQTIVPGKSIGLIKLNEQAEVVYKLLGQPAATDAAMGKMLATWLSEPKLSEPRREHYQTNIFFARNMGSAEESSQAKQIRVTSPEYKLENRIGVGSDLKTIQAHFPEMKKAAVYTTDQTKEKITIYHDKKAGIAFEIDRTGKCTGIGIQEPGKANFEVYSAISADLKKV